MVRKRARLRSLDVPLHARNRALDYLANRRHQLSEELRYQLTQVVEGYMAGAMKTRRVPASSGCAIAWAVMHRKENYQRMAAAA
jgi:hypothetical protein